MAKELKKIEQNPLDGFDYDDQYEGREETAGGIIVGTRLKFTNDNRWLGNGEALPAGLELLVIDYIRVLTYWKDGKPDPDKTRVLAADELIPDVDALNKDAPQEDWSESFGKRRGPYELQRVLYLVDPRDMSRFTYPTSTDGGEIAIRELNDRIKMKRKLRGKHVCPVVILSDRFMPTSYGGRQRPHFIVQRWVDLGGGGQPAASTPPMLEAAPAPIERIVEEPTLAEEMDDAIPDLDVIPPKPKKAVRKGRK